MNGRANCTQAAYAACVQLAQADGCCKHYPARSRAGHGGGGQTSPCYT